MSNVPSDLASSDLADCDATAHAELIRTRQLSPLEAVDAAIARIESTNPRLNAVIWTCFEQARSAASDRGAAEGPFGGVPFLLKDIGATQRGLPLWMGNAALRAVDYRSDADTELGARFRRAGFVTLGKTNLPELGSSPTAQPSANGPTANPWDPQRSPAGSSGGSAAAVAAGLVPVAHANDGGGSTRLPASWCGLVGLKTSRGRMPMPEGISRLTSELVVSRTVRDTAAVLDAVHGPTDADLYQIAPPARPYVEELGAPVAPMRIALLVDGGGVEIDPECVDAVHASARTLESMGHRIEPVDGSVLFGGELGRVNGQLWMAALSRRVEHVGELLGRAVIESDFEAYNWAAAQRGRALSASEWTAGQERQQDWTVLVTRWLAGFDALLTPTSGCPPLRTEDLVPHPETPWRIGRIYGRIGRFTLPFNATGHPAISLPLHQSAAGLPVGVQIVAGFGREDLLIRLASHLEEAVPWSGHRPAVHAGA